MLARFVRRPVNSGRWMLLDKTLPTWGRCRTAFSAQIRVRWPKDSSILAKPTPIPKRQLSNTGPMWKFYPVNGVPVSALRRSWLDLGESSFFFDAAFAASLSMRTIVNSFVNSASQKSMANWPFASECKGIIIDQERIDFYHFYRSSASRLARQTRRPRFHSKKSFGVERDALQHRFPDFSRLGASRYIGESTGPVAPAEMIR